MYSTAQSLAPEKVRHSWVNMYRDPYKNPLPFDYKPKGPFDDFQKNIDFLFDTFLESYNLYNAGEMPDDLEEEYKKAYLPGPLQYKAFRDLFAFFEHGELELLRRKKFYYYALTEKITESEMGIIEFLEKLDEFDFANQDKKVIFCCGSFWNNLPEIQKKALKIFDNLYTNKGIDVKLYMNCKEEEIRNCGHDEFIHKMIENGSRFGLEKRIPIHFVQAGNDYFFIEFPHGERIVVRLNLFLDLKEITYQNNSKKDKVEQYFEGLIQQAL